MRVMRRSFIGATLALCVLSLGVGCATSSYQTAKMLPAQGVRLTGALSSYDVHDDGDSGSESAYEVMGAYGLNEKTEIGGKLVMFDTDLANAYHVIVIPKFSITPDKL